MCRLVVFCGAMLIAAQAVAGEQLAKEGKFSGTYHAVGTLKTTDMGKDASVHSLDEMAYSVGEGILDHVAWHCYGSFGIFAGNARWGGLCVGNDLSGERMMVNFESDGTPGMDAKTWQAHAHFIGGTGKYTGITGGWSYSFHPFDFKPASDNNYLLLINYEGSYKLQ